MIEHVHCEGRTIFVRINPESVLPKFLRAAVGRVGLELNFLGYEQGTAFFALKSSVLSLPVHKLVNFITSAIHLPDGISITKGVDAPHLRINVQRFIDQQVSGVILQELHLHEGDLIAIADLAQIQLKK